MAAGASQRPQRSKSRGGGEEGRGGGEDNGWANLHCLNRPTFQVNDTLSPSVTTSEIVLQGPDFIMAEIGGGMLAAAPLQKTPALGDGSHFLDFRPSMRRARLKLHRQKMHNQSAVLAVVIGLVIGQVLVMGVPVVPKAAGGPSPTPAPGESPISSDLAKNREGCPSKRPGLSP